MVYKLTTLLAMTLSATLVTASAIDKRVIGGEEAKLGEFPFIVSINAINGHPIQQCAGTLVDSKTVVTAAHCLEQVIWCREQAGRCPGTVFNVRAGSLAREKDGVLVDVQNFHIHPSYDNKVGSANDIAILKLAAEISESASVKYAKLPASGSDPAVASGAVVAGWGTIAQGAPVAKTLRRVNVPILTRGDCAGAVDTMVCAGAPGKDSCQGDSGGPLVDKASGQLIGVVSSGVSCGTKGLYTRVASFVPFVEEYLGEAGFDPRR
ncbi:trypsin precursor [Cordyceps militaris]|uniref:Trypsin n=1 Tax=Cordyceps militaris TaxID=73501 RepID=A0A2H4SWE5_CORMI|nr:trypsin precursor [Cordyceps militaris]